jgi:acetolactate synthase-like protein
VAQEGVPGPVFVEVPVDLLYPEENVRQFYGAKAASETKSLPELALQGYLRVHLARVFAGASKHVPGPRIRVDAPRPFRGAVERAAKLLREAERPVMVLGSQATLQPDELPRLVSAIEAIGVPVYLSGMARGLLGASHPLWFRHNRGKALKEADLVLLAGVPCDFRLDYGLQISRKAKLVAVNRSESDAKKNRRPTLAVVADPTELLCALAENARPPKQTTDSPARVSWRARLRTRDDEREEQIAEQTAAVLAPMNPLAVVKAIDAALADDSVQVADGGDFVATASYVTRARSPLSWLDPGAFGTLGVGAGFALGAKLCRPDAEVWVLYGDGSVGYSIAEFDTFVRHGLPVIAVVGNDASWQQIARDQVVLLGDDVGTVLARSDYHRVVEGFGAKGLQVERVEDLPEVLAQAKAAAAGGTPVLINAHIGKSEFRKGSISM